MGTEVEVLQKDTVWWYVSHAQTKGYFPASCLQEVPAGTSDLPPGWQRFVSSTGAEYFFNAETRTTTWARPVAVSTPASVGPIPHLQLPIQQEPLPEGWQQCAAADGRTFFFNTVTRVSQWQRPTPVVVQLDDADSDKGDEDRTIEEDDDVLERPSEMHTVVANDVEVEEEARQDTVEGPEAETVDLQPYVAMLTTGANMQKKLRDESKYGPRFVFMSDDMSNLCWSRGVKQRRSARGVSFDQIQAIARGPPQKVRKSDLRMPNFAECAFSIICSGQHKRSTVDFVAESEAIATKWQEALRCILVAIRKGTLEQGLQGSRTQQPPSPMAVSKSSFFGLGTPRFQGKSVSVADMSLKPHKRASTGSEAEAPSPIERKLIPLPEVLEPPRKPAMVVQSMSDPTGLTLAAAAAASINKAGGGGRPNLVGLTHFPILPDDLQSEIRQFSISGYAERFFSVQKSFGLVRRRALSANEMVTFTDRPLQQALTQVAPEMSKAAVKIFLKVMAYMGDDGGRTAGDYRTLQQIVAEATNPELRDEVYCQLAKQTSDNPSVESEERGWELLAACATSFAPRTILLGRAVCSHADSRRWRHDAIGGLAFYTYETVLMAINGNVRPRMLSSDELTVIRSSFVPEKVFGEKLERVLLKELFLVNPAARMPPRQHLLDTNAVPQVLVCLCEAIKNLGGCTTEGIFRRAAPVEDVTFFRQELERCRYGCLDPANPDGIIVRDPLVVADILKIWLRSMPEPVIPFTLYSACVNAGRRNDLVAVQQALSRLPPAHRSTLSYVAQFIRKLAEYRSQTQMDVHNLCLVLAPNILRNPTDDAMLFATNADSEKRFLQCVVEVLAPPS